MLVAPACLQVGAFWFDNICQQCLTLSLGLILLDLLVLECLGELLTVVLSVYMYENGANIQLPEADEILMCNSSTTTEDVSQSLVLVFSTTMRSCH